MKKRSMHRIHLDDGIWKWYVKGLRGGIIIFAPSGKRHEVTLGNIARSFGLKGTDYEIDCIADDSARGIIPGGFPTITPAIVKTFILRYF